MPEPKPSDQYDIGERMIQREVVRRLRAAGWLVMVTSQARSTGRQTAGLPDLLAFRHDHTLLIECKSAFGALRESQRVLMAEIQMHEGPHLTYAVVRRLQDVEVFC